MCALATLVLWKDEVTLVPWLKTELANMLNTRKAPEQEIRDRAARETQENAPKACTTPVLSCRESIMQ